MSYPPQPPAPPQPPQGPQGPQGQYPPQQYPQQQYQQPYQQPYGQYPQAPVQPKTSPMALTAFIMVLAGIVIMFTRVGWLGWLLNLTAFILGIVANGQIKRSMGALTGKGFAVSAIVISSILFGLLVLVIILAIIGMATMGGTIMEILRQSGQL